MNLSGLPRESLLNSIGMAFDSRSVHYSAAFKAWFKDFVLCTCSASKFSSCSPSTAKEDIGTSMAISFPLWQKKAPPLVSPGQSLSPKPFQDHRTDSSINLAYLQALLIPIQTFVWTCWIQRPSAKLQDNTHHLMSKKVLYKDSMSLHSVWVQPFLNFDC